MIIDNGGQPHLLGVGRVCPLGQAAVGEAEQHDHREDRAADAVDGRLQGTGRVATEYLENRVTGYSSTVVVTSYCYYSSSY